MSYKSLSYMRMLSRWIACHRALLQEVYGIAKAKGVSLYLVGGIIRDVFMKRKKESPDFDFCLQRGALAFARSVAKKLNAGFVVLDSRHGCARVVVKGKASMLTLDFTDFRGKTLHDDLLHRDFTINSMALAITQELFAKTIAQNALIDPSSGRGDLEKRIIRMAHAGSFDEDPLRILRAFSLAAVFRMKIEVKTLRAIQKARKKLGTVSAERIRDEFMKILSSGHAYESLAQLDKYKILDVFLPELAALRKVAGGPYHHLDVWNHTLETCRHLDLVLAKALKNPFLQVYLLQEVSFGRKRYEVIKLAGLLHDIGKPRTLRIEKRKISFHGHERVGADMASAIAERLKLSNEENRALRSLILAHLRPGFLSDCLELTPRARFRFFRDAGSWAAGVLLLSLADQRATCGRLATPESRMRHEKLVRTLLKGYFRAQKEGKMTRLVDGNDIMKRFRLTPSPLIGKILKALDESQGIGLIQTREDAFRHAQKFIKSA